MSFDVGAAHRALADQLRESFGEAFNVYPFPETGPTFPAIMVEPAGDWISPFGTFGSNGHGDVSVLVTAYLEGLTAEDRATWAFRLASAGLDASGNAQPLSLMDVLLADKTLGGAVATATPTPGAAIQWDAENDAVSMPVLIVLKKSGANA